MFLWIVLVVLLHTSANTEMEIKFHEYNWSGIPLKYKNIEFKQNEKTGQEHIYCKIEQEMIEMIVLIKFE